MDVMEIVIAFMLLTIFAALAFLIFTAGLFLLDVGGSDIPDQVREYLYPPENEN